MESRVETGGNGRTKRAQVGTEGNHMFCTACGSQLPGGALFCSRCGNKVAGMQQPQITEFYHGTSVEAAMSIQATGFDVSRSGSNAGAMLGPGLYVTTTLQKALTYATTGHRPHGGAVFKLKVDLGNCYTVRQNDPYMSRWQERYDSAWSADGVNGKMEEHCIKDPRPPRVQIVDVILANTRTASEGSYWMSNGRLTFAGMATSIHVRGDGIGSTTLRKKADPARTKWVDGMASVKQEEKVTVFRFDGPFSLVRLASGAEGFVQSKYLRPT